MTKGNKNSEKRLEKRLFSEVQRRRGNAVKFFSGVDTGWPDRWVLLPGGRIYFIELKTEGETPDPIQVSKHKWLEKSGFQILVIDTDEKLNSFLNRIDREILTP